jgi:ketosteroid isomerase-like protein
MRTFLLLLSTAILSASCGNPTSPPTAGPAAGADSGAHLAHKAYVTAINSNNLDELLAVLTDDVVFLSAHEPAMVGKAAVRPWLEAYLKAFIERYSYKSTDTPLAGGAVVEDTGWGLAIYHHDADGKWRVARDAFGPDHPPAAR